MVFQNTIEQYLLELRELERFFREAQSKEILPLSYFSSSIDILNRLRTGINEIEAAQLKVMQEHLKKSEQREPVEVKEEPGKTEEVNIPEEKPTHFTGSLVDTINRKINTDFGRSLSLNDRFMLRRDLFRGDADKMNQMLAEINAFQSQKEVMAFLDEKYAISWNSEAGIVFKELLDKRFI